MMLSDRDIRRVVAEGQLKLEPFSDECIRPAGVTLHLGETLLQPQAGKVVDVRTGQLPDYKSISLADDAHYDLQPGEFILGHTYQKVWVGSRLGFLIEGRSTLARVGLTVVQTAMLVYPGHSNRAVTLELANHGPNPVRLYARMKIARVALFELSSPSEVQYDDYGKYREQSSVGLPIFADEFLHEE